MYDLCMCYVLCVLYLWCLVCCVRLDFCFLFFGVCWFRFYTLGICVFLYFNLHYIWVGWLASGMDIYGYGCIGELQLATGNLDWIYPLSLLIFRIQVFIQQCSNVSYLCGYICMYALYSGSTSIGLSWDSQCCVDSRGYVSIVQAIQ